MLTQKFTLSGLHCPACKKVTEKRIGTIPGVTRVEVDLNSGVMTVQADNEVTHAQIEEALKDTQYLVLK